MKDRGFMAIPPGAIIPGVLPAFRIYIPEKSGKYVLWAREGNKVSPEQLAKLSENGIKEIFVDLGEQWKYEQYLETNLGKILENQLSPDDQKASIFSKVSTNVLKNAFQTSLGMKAIDSGVMQRTEALVRNALIFIKESKSIHALAKMIGHDYQTYQHATKVLWFTVAFLRNNPDVAEKIQPGYNALDEKQQLDILEKCGVGALLHDIGKAFVSQEILNKDGPLTDVEWEIMRRHPLSGLAMLLDSELPLFVKQAILQHHEDFHGKGYPMGVEGLSINVLARLLRIIDTFDAMTSRRPYKPPLSPSQTVKIMVGTPDRGEGGDSEPYDRDQGMKRCFDEDLLRRFILFLGNVKLTS
jgi:HD-GYP domain-containing protein (c-di-GMP phosphodiesterase class II)